VSRARRGVNEGLKPTTYFDKSPQWKEDPPEKPVAADSAGSIAGAGSLPPQP